jgi:acyl-CoA ligase (AMP-forming) (exosortase A-associated)
MNQRTTSPHVLIIVENLPVPLDRRVWLECQALIKRGYSVSVICPRGPGDPARERIDEVDIYKYKPARQAKGALGFAWEFAYSWVRTAVLSLEVRRNRRIDIIQACNPPDTYWLLALLWRPFGVRFVYDHHDLNPELFISRFGEPRGRVRTLQYRGLVGLERATFRAAHRVISTNESYKAIAVRRGKRRPDEVTVVRSGPDTTRMRPIYPDRPRAAEEITLVYLGIMGPQDGVDQVLLVVDELVHRRGRTNVKATLLGFGDCLADLMAQSTALGLDGHVTFTGRVDKVAIAEQLSRSDIGLCPDLKTPLNDLSTMNKTMEYMAYALPAVSFDLLETRVSGGDTLLYVPSGDIAAFADAVETLIDDPALRIDLAKKARARVATLLDWRPQSVAYLSVYDGLTGLAPLPTQDPPAAGEIPASRDPEGRRYVDLDDAEEFDRYLRERSPRAEWSESMMPARTSLHHLLSQAAATTPDAPALTYRDETVTFAETWRAVQAAAAQLLELGLQPGARVAIYLEKRLETVASFFAVSAAGGVFVPINHVLKSAQVGHILGDSGAEVLVTSADRLATLRSLLPDTRIAHVIIVDEAGPDPAAFWQVSRWGDGQAAAGTPRPSPSIDIDPAAILYTSGSTGAPKGVVLSHRNLIVGAESVSTYLQNTPDDVILSVLPLSFDAGLSQVTTAMSVGAHCVLMNYLVPRDVPRLCAKYKVTGLTCVPPLWLQLAELDWPAESTGRMRYWANTGGRMPRTTLDRLRGIFSAADPYLMYGLTEAFRSTYLHPSEIDRRPDSIGKAIPNAEILVLRPDGTPCAPGEEGELVHRGALVALGYWNDPARTDERYRPVRHAEQEWRAPERAVWSGDTVVADEEGFLYFVGRHDDMIKTSGYRVSPSEVEDAAHSTGLVREAVAMGVEDAELGQRIVLSATPAAGELDVDALTAALKRALPVYLVPSYIDVRSELPRSANGKYDRARIRSELRSDVRK